MTETTDAKKDEYLNIRVDSRLMDLLREAASQNERTVAGEVRLALRRYLRENGDAA